MGTEEITFMWGTWEELVLGGAVLRHGSQDWDVVATELRARTPFPCVFTPEVCKTKYEDLQQHYSSCKDLFEELRKKRMAELKRSLEQSDDSIGSLQKKLHTLKTERVHNCQPDYGSSETESLVPLSSSKETSKDGLSAGSFTQETRKIWSPESHIPAASCGDMETKPETSVSSEQGKVSSVERLAKTIQSAEGLSITKRRGKRKRKGSGKDIKEVSVGESDFLGSTSTLPPPCLKENTSENGPVAGPSSMKESNQGLSREKPDDLVIIFYSIMANNFASIYCRRLDSQKRARYKRTIKQHTDLDTIRSRLDKGRITSAKELFRDLLLLSNNAVIFYSKNTREHKYAVRLRDLVTKILREHRKGPNNKDSVNHATSFSNSSLSDPPVKPPGKPRSVRRGISGKPVISGDVESSQGGKKPNKVSSPLPAEGFSPAKKANSKQHKGGHGGTTRHRAEIPLKEKKEARRR